MKFALLFVLGLCAFSAQASSYNTIDKEAELFAIFDPVYTPMLRDGVFEKVKEFVDSVIESIKNTVQSIVEKAKEISSSSSEKIMDIVKNAADKVMAFVNDTDAKLVELTNKGAAYKKCVEQYKPELAELYEKAKEDVKTCTSDALETAESLHGNVVDQLLAVKSQITALRDAIKMCYQPSSPVASMTCAVAKAKDVKEAISTIISSVTGAVNSAATLVSEAYSCVMGSISENKAQAQAIVEQIKICASS